MKVQTFLVILASSTIGEAAGCYTNIFGMMTGAKPFGPGCGSPLPIGNKPGPQQVTVTATVTSTVVSTTTLVVPTTTTSTLVVPTTITETTTEVSTSTTTTTATTTSSMYGLNPAATDKALAYCSKWYGPANQEPLFNDKGKHVCCGPFRNADGQKLCPA